MRELVDAVVDQHFERWDSGLDSQDIQEVLAGCYIWSSTHPSCPGSFYSVEKLHKHLSFFIEKLVRNMIHRAYADDDYVVVLMWGANINVVKLKRGSGEIVEYVSEFNEQIAI